MVRASDPGVMHEGQVYIPTGKRKRTMPFKSEAQRGAMYAAARGESNIGIPKSVARSYVKHDKGKCAPKRPKRKPGGFGAIAAKNGVSM